MMKNLILIITVLIASLNVYSQNSDEAKKLLDQVSTTMKSYENVYIEFEYSLINKAAGVEQNNEGNVLLSGEKYNATFFEVNQIYDGAKTYTIIPENEEVNISSSNSEEENVITPSKFYSFYENGFSYALGNKKELDGKNLQYVKLSPIDSDSDLSEIIVGIDLKVNHIYTITEIGKNSTKTVLKVVQFLTNQPVDQSKFEFNRKKYDDLGYIINE